MQDEQPRSCPDAEVIYGYVEGLLADAEADACRRHVTACPKCAATVQQAREGQKLIEFIRDAQPSEAEQQVIDTGTEQLRRSLGDAPS